VTAEPRVEELLATIRKAIDQDINELDRRAGVQPPENRALRGAIHEMRIAPVEPARPQAQEPEENISQLRERINRHRMAAHEEMEDDSPPPPPTVMKRLTPRNASMAAIISGQRPDAQPIGRFPDQSNFPPVPPQPRQAGPQNGYDTDYAQGGWQQEPPAEPHYQPPTPPQLMSPEAASSAQSSFQTLAQSVLSKLGGDGRLDEVAREILRPLLKQWLDDNLPSLVERLVREEIERVARRGR
jgi:uncharacterized protein